MNLYCYSITNTTTASHLIPTNRLCRLMHFATLNDLHMAETRDFDLAGEISPGARRLRQIKTLVFGTLGKRLVVALSSSPI
jgi:hypothetical protein